MKEKKIVKKSVTGAEKKCALEALHTIRHALQCSGISEAELIEEGKKVRLILSAERTDAGESESY